VPSIDQVEDAWRSERLEGLPDPNLESDLDTQEFVKLVELSLWCVRKRSEERPFMCQVRRFPTCFEIYDLYRLLNDFEGKCVR